MLVNSLLGQKQETSLLDVHLGARVSQVLIHWGTVSGQGADGAGLDTGKTPVGTARVLLAVERESVSVAAVAVVAHWVHIVETEVRVTVETVLDVATKVEEPEVTVLVTGQVVSVTYVITVVESPSGMVGVELASMLDKTTLVIAGPVGAVVGATSVSEGAGVLPAATELGRLEVEVRVTVETVLDVVTKVDDPEVIVAVTGQVVSVT